MSGESTCTNFEVADGSQLHRICNVLPTKAAKWQRDQDSLFASVLLSPVVCNRTP